MKNLNLWEVMRNSKGPEKERRAVEIARDSEVKHLNRQGRS
jgi:hypothetical protein